VILFEGDNSLTTVQKLTRENRTERDQSKSAANSLLKHSGDCVMQFLKTKVAYVIFSDAALNGNNKTYER
jgi:hypothetical protein